MPLTAHQKEKHDEIIGLYKQGHKRVILQGSAGTGKTFTADEILKTIRRDYTINPAYNNGTIYSLAPTNKALAVLANRVTVPCELATVHSACKLTPFTHPKSGIEEFRQQKVYGKPKGNEFDKCKFALIDECSMLGKALEGSAPHMEENPEDIKEGYLQKFNMPTLYMGDEKQLNPVKETYSPVFHKGYPVVTLTEIVRQGAGNPIIELSNDIDLLFFKQPNIIDGKGYLYSNDKEQIIEHLAEVNGSDELKYLAYMNDVIDDINLQVRNRIYKTPKKIECGESIIFNKPFLKYYTSQDLKIVDLDIVTDYIDIPTEKTKWDMSIEYAGKMDRLKFKYYLINNEVKVLHEHSERVYSNLLTSIRDKCNNKGWDFRAKKYVEEKMFANYKYNHAITIHKSQGSTYKQTVINIGNVMFNQKADERERMLYTAITRASDLIILNNVK